MREHTTKQNNFIDGVVSGLSKSEAYRKAGYKTVNMTVSKIAKKAGELANRGDIGGIIEQRKRELANKAIWDRELSLKMLKAIIDEARTNTIYYKEETKIYNAAAANTAIKAIEQANKMCGYNEPQKIELTGTLNLSLEEKLKEITGEKY